MNYFHVHFQHGSAHKFLLADSAFDKLLNTFKVIILPVVVNPIFAYPSLGVVTTVWVSAGIPENDAEYKVRRSENHIIVAMGGMDYF